MLKTVLMSSSIIVSLAFVLTAPAFSQNRFMDEARERAERLKENDSVRQAEHPEIAQPPVTPASPSPVEAKTAEAVPAQTKASSPAQ
jgi:hypothetical protein